MLEKLTFVHVYSKWRWFLTMWSWCRLLLQSVKSSGQILRCWYIFQLQVKFKYNMVADSIMQVIMSWHINSVTEWPYPGRTGHHNISQVENSKLSAKFSRTKLLCEFSREQSSSTSESSVDEKNVSNDFCDGCLCLAPRAAGGRYLNWILLLRWMRYGHCILRIHRYLWAFATKLIYHPHNFVSILKFSGLSNLYPADIIPFTRKPLFLIIDSDNSHAFKAGLSKLVHL